MALTRTTADAVLKEFYLPGIRNILNNEVFLLSQVETNSEDVEGRRAVLAINTDRNNGVGARAEYGTLPVAGQQGYREERVGLKYNYGRIEISGPTMRSMGSDRGSFTRAVQSETTGVVRDLRNDVNRQLYGDGTGIIATAGASAASNTVTLTAPTATQLRQLQIGMVVDVGTAANPTSSFASRTITATTPTNFTFSGATAAITAADRVTRAGSGGTGANQKEITGLAAQVNNTGSLWNIDPATTPNWVSYVDANAGTPRAVTEALFIKAAQEVNIMSGEDIDLWITDSDTHRKVASLMTSLKRFPSTTELRGGYSALDMSNVSQGNTGSNTVSMFYDKDCQTGTAWGLTTKRLQFYKMSDWEFMEEDGAVLNRVPNIDAYEATLFLYAELATDGRNAHAKLADLSPTL